MKLKSILITALSLSLLAGCQSEEENISEQTSTPSIEESTEHSNTEQAKTIMKEPNSNVEEATEPEPEQLPSQTIQQEPGETQKDNYFTWETDNAVYKQIGDAFITTSKYDDTRILVIPINFTNKSEDASDPWTSFAIDFKAYQEDDNQEYILSGGQGLIPDEYSNPTNTYIKKDGNTDHYLSFTLELPEEDAKVSPQLDDGSYTFTQN